MGTTALDENSTVNGNGALDANGYFSDGSHASSDAKHASFDAFSTNLAGFAIEYKTSEPTPL